MNAASRTAGTVIDLLPVTTLADMVTVDATTHAERFSRTYTQRPSVLSNPQRQMLRQLLRPRHPWMMPFRLLPLSARPRPFAKITSTHATCDMAGTFVSSTSSLRFVYLSTDHVVLSVTLLHTNLLSRGQKSIFASCSHYVDALMQTIAMAPRSQLHHLSALL